MRAGVALLSAKDVGCQPKIVSGAWKIVLEWKTCFKSTSVPAKSQKEEREYKRKHNSTTCLIIFFLSYCVALSVAPSAPPCLSRLSAVAQSLSGSLFEMQAPWHWRLILVACSPISRTSTACSNSNIHSHVPKFELNEIL